MVRGTSSSSSSKPNTNARASSSGTKGDDSRPPKPAAKQGAHSSGPALKRTNSLPSQPRQPTEIKPNRKPITPPVPDRRSPTDFQYGLGTRAGAGFKQDAMERILAEHFMKDSLASIIESSPYYMECLKSMHPKVEHYTPEKKAKAYRNLAMAHPRLRAEVARKRNAMYSVPNYATSSRLMKPMEQKFLSSAMRHIQRDVVRKPFHMHGESCVTGDRNGKVVQFMHNAGDSVISSIRKGDKYTVHNHPPFVEPLTSSASEQDHKTAAESYLYLNNQMKEYFTNGVDVLHIQPASLELVKLLPDPKVEAVIGKFPVAFRLPTPQQPPHPFSNHEAPAAFKKDWAPPAGWKPPEDYPRDVPSQTPRHRRR